MFNYYLKYNTSYSTVQFKHSESKTDKTSIEVKSFLHLRTYTHRKQQSELSYCSEWFIKKCNVETCMIIQRPFRNMFKKNCRILLYYF